MERTREELLHQLSELYTNIASEIELKEEYYKFTYECFSHVSYTDKDLLNLINVIGEAQ